MAVITISRQVGSGGDEVARQLCERLKYRYFDKRLMVEAAADEGISEKEIVDFNEDRYEVRSFLSRLFRASQGTVLGATPLPVGPPDKETLGLRALDQDECVDMIRYTVNAAYRMGNVVIMGRGGQAILKEKPGVLHVRIVAPHAARMERLRQEGISGISELKLTIRQRDSASEEYLKRFYGIQWDDPELYHLIINTGTLSIPAAVEGISAMVRQMEVAPAG